MLLLILLKNKSILIMYMSDEKLNLEYEYELIKMTQNKNFLSFSVLDCYNPYDEEQNDKIQFAYESIKKYTNTNHFKNNLEDNYSIETNNKDFKIGDVLYTTKYKNRNTFKFIDSKDCYYEIIRITPKRVYVRNLLCNPILSLYIDSYSDEKNIFVCVIKKGLYYSGIIRPLNKNRIKKVYRFNEYVYAYHNEFGLF